MYVTLEVRTPCVEQFEVFVTTPTGFQVLKVNNRNKKKNALNAYKVLAKTIVCSYAFVDSLDCT